MPANTSGRSWLLIGLLALSMAAMGLLAAQPPAWEGFVAAALAAGIFAGLLWRRKDVSTFTVIVVALIVRLLVVWLPPVLSDDFYRYVWDGVVQAEGLNPYLHTPDATELASLHDDPIFDRLNSESYFTVYPPISQFVFRVGAYFYGYGWEVSYFVIKGLFALMEFGAVLVLARLLRPEQLILYAWNPLVVLSGSGQGHGEAALVLFLSLTLIAIKRHRGGRAAVWLACAGWVKLYPFVLMPFLWRRYGWRSAAAGTAATGMIAAPYFHPEVIPNVLESLDLYVSYFEFNAGPYYGVKKVFQLFTGQDWSKQLGPAFRVTFLAVLPVLYVLDWKLDWSPRRAFAVTLGAFLLCATTVHPWYLLGILPLVAGAPRPSWHWHWLSLLSIGTYLLYVDGPYWPWVTAGWLGWGCLATVRYRRRLFEPIMRARAKGKANLVAPLLEKGWSVLDIGAAEGYVGRSLSDQVDGDVHLVDVLDIRRTSLPFRLYDGRTLPYASDQFDAGVLVFVLHHAEDPETVLLEAMRVCRHRLVVLESTYEQAWERAPLEWLDRIANHIRSEGAMADQVPRFRSHEDWLATFDRLGFSVEGARDLGGFIHHRSLFVLGR